jgi:hypothetical protein
MPRRAGEIVKVIIRAATLELPNHRKDRGDSDPGCEEKVFAGAFDQFEIVARFADLQPVAERKRMHRFRSAARRSLELYRDDIMIRRIGGIADGIMPDQLVSEPDADVRACIGPWQRAACFRLESKGSDTFSLKPDGGDAN